jgi:hypothetical protein
MAEILQIIDGGGLLAFCVMAYFVMQKTGRKVEEALEKMVDVITKQSADTAVIKERQAVTMARQEDIRIGLNKKLGANTIPPLTRVGGNGSAAGH